MTALGLAPTGVASVVPWFMVLVPVLLGVLVAMLSLRHRQRRLAEALHARIEQLEEALAALVPAAVPNDPPAPVPAAPQGPAPDPAPNPSGDVLAGRTSHIRRLLDGAGPELRSLGDQAILCLHEHVAESVTPSDLAQHLCVSLRTLERGLCQALACTPRQLILTMKMREARRMLLQGYRVAEVAERLGFEDAFHFSRRFKSHYHIPPSRIRPAAGGAGPTAAP